MQRPLDPLGILIGQVLPAILLFLAYADVLRVAHPLLDADAITLWRQHAFVLAFLAGSALAYLIWARLNGRSVSALYAGISFVATVVLLYAFTTRMDAMLPWSLPRWMVPQDAQLYAFRFLALPMAYSLFVLVLHSLPAGARGRPVRDLLIAVAIPLSVYLFVQVVEPWRLGVDFERHVWIVLMITLVVAFLFFLFRAVLAMVRRTGPKASIWGLVLRALVALVLPLLGLAVNNGVFDTPGNGMGEFGDLAHPAFYLIALLNGVVVLWPSSAEPRIRLLQFILRGIGFSYVLYFFLLFLPFLPLSIVAILAFGLGFLMLAPVLLFLVQGSLLLEDLQFLSGHHSRIRLGVAFLLALLVIPAVITARYIRHRTVLHEALAHVYHPDLSAPDVASIDPDALGQVLDRIETQQGGGGGRRSSTHTPFLSQWYDRIVLDNLTMGRTRTDALRQVFLDESRAPSTPQLWGIPDREVELVATRSESQHDPAQQAWRSWVHMDMTYHGTGQGEYVATIDLPDGAWISDQYLMIEGKRVPGVLAEKKAATWVYQQIVNVRRDPSLTRYVAPGRVQTRVFPFAPSETRRAGIEILHKEPFTLVLDGDTLQLGDRNTAPLAGISTARDGRTTYIPATHKEQLPRIRRTPHLHVVVDGSASRKDERAAVLERVEKAIDRLGIGTEAVTLHITDAYVTSVAWNEGRVCYLDHVGRGGFFSDRAVRRILHAACATPSPVAPVIMLAGSATSFINSDPDDGGDGTEASKGTTTLRPDLAHEDLGVLLDDLVELAACLPEAPYFHLLDGSGGLHRRHFAEPAVDAAASADEELLPEVLAWPNTSAPKAYLPNTIGGSIAVHGTAMQNDLSPFALRNWSDALALEGAWRWHQLHPEGGTAAWRALVRGSFEAQVLTPVTAWMCLENDAQRNALLKKQEEVLKGEAALDAGDDDLMRMSEPPFWWMILLVLPWLWYRSRRAG